MGSANDLTKGNINKILFNLTLPIVGSSFLQLSYGLVDMIWIGKLGSEAIAGVGTANFILHFCLAINSLVTIGTGIKVSHAIGEKDMDKAKEYIIIGRLMNIGLFLLCAMILILFSYNIVGFFNLNNTVTGMAQDYLKIAGLGLFFKFQNFLYTGVFNSFGISKLPFKINLVGVSINLILDPIFIFSLGMGVQGAAIATLVAEATVTLLLVINSRKFFKLDRFFSDKIQQFKEVCTMGAPIALQNILFTSFSIVIARIISQWGSEAIASQRIGIQIESLSYMTIGGLHGAIASFIGQNYGAKLYDRILKGYKTAFSISLQLGVFLTVALVVFAEPLAQIFVSDVLTITLTTEYLRIVGLSQAFMCIEIMTSGAFNGIGKTKIPAILSIVFTGLRIPLALFLSQETMFGLEGIWMSIALTTVFKGILSPMIYFKSLGKSENFYREQYSS